MLQQYSVVPKILWNAKYYQITLCYYLFWTFVSNLLSHTLITIVHYSSSGTGTHQHNYYKRYYMHHTFSYVYPTLLLMKCIILFLSTIIENQNNSASLWNTNNVLTAVTCQLPFFCFCVAEFETIFFIL